MVRFLSLFKKSYILKQLLMFLVLSIPHGAFGEEKNASDVTEIVVSDSRIISPPSTTETSIINFDKSDQVRPSNALEYIDATPGVDSSNNGSLGIPPTIFIRGSSSEHVKVLLDDVDISDPTFSTRLSPFTLINMTSLSNVELFKGSDSVSYGPGALGGALNFNTKRGKGPQKLTTFFETGRYETLKESVALSKGTDSHDYFIELSKADSKGISSASSEYGNAEQDGFHNFNATGHFGLALSDNVSSSLIFKHGSNSSDLDMMGGKNGDDPNYISKSNQNLIIGKTKLFLFSEQVEQEVTASHFSTKRRLLNPLDTAHPTDYLDEKYHGERSSFSVKNALSISSKYALLISGDLSQDQSIISSESQAQSFSNAYCFNKKSSLYGLALTHILQPTKQLTFKAGLRQDFFHSENRNLHPLHQRFEASWQYSQHLKLFTGYGKSHNFPTLYQLYSTYGHENLSSEQSESKDISIVYTSENKREKASLTYFNTHTVNLIDFDFMTMHYYNLGKSETKGFESQIEAEINPRIKAAISYTQTDAHNVITNERLLRRPLHKYTSQLSYQPTRSFILALSGIFVRERKDFTTSDIGFEKVTLKPYNLVQSNVKYLLSEDSSIFIRIENLTDTVYEEVAGYGTFRRSLFAGAEIVL